VGDGVDYKALYDRVGEVTGWDFGRLHVIEEGREWYFYDKIVEHCDPSTVLLDIGTGGGKKVLQIAPAVLLLVGVDISAEMVRVAQKSLRASQAKNVRFHQMAAQSLRFPENFFDVVSCRQAAFSPAEVARVLRQDGVFLTQQVSEADKLNIKQAFGRGQGFGVPDGTLKERYIAELGELGFDVQTFEYDATEYYQTVEDMIFLLRNTPIIPDLGKDGRDFDTLARLIAENQTDKGIRTNSKRFMIVARRV
jgi:SAM-dependent methyltransferase